MILRLHSWNRKPSSLGDEEMVLCPLTGKMVPAGGEKPNLGILALIGVGAYLVVEALFPSKGKRR